MSDKSTYAEHQPSKANPALERLDVLVGEWNIEITDCMLYFDSRGVSRIYQMSLSGGVWKLWRDFPGFSQRFTGTFSDDKNVITAQWEKSSGGLNWEHDFNLLYTKVS